MNTLFVRRFYVCLVQALITWTVCSNSKSPLGPQHIVLVQKTSMPWNSYTLFKGAGMDITGGGPGQTPPSPPLTTKKVMIFGHKKRDPQLAILGSPLPVHVHGGGGDDATWDKQHI